MVDDCSRECLSFAILGDSRVTGSAESSGQATALAYGVNGAVSTAGRLRIDCVCAAREKTDAVYFEIEKSDKAC